MANREMTMLRYVVSLVAVASCAVDDVEPVGHNVQEIDSPNGTSLNGTSLNGTSLNGTSLNGTTLTGVAVSGLTSAGVTVKAASGTALPLSGASLVGSTWTGTAQATTGLPVSLKLRIDSALQGTGTNADLWFYGVSYQTSSTWTPLCGLDTTGKPIQAVSVAGTWSTFNATYAPSTTQYTWACRTKTIAKCVELGYKTWKGYANQLAACVRLLRADYCGSGISHTVDGTLLNLYDNVGVQSDTEGWKVEAEWMPTGARCINSNNAARYEKTTTGDPLCLKSLESTTCGTFAHGALLIDELSP
jgi:hypothetical protein